MWNIPVGSLDDDPGLEPKGHIYVGSKADWFEITGDLPRYEEMPVDWLSCQSWWDTYRWQERDNRIIPCNFGSAAEVSGNVREYR